MNNILAELGALSLVPVVKIDRVESAVPLARALLTGGLPCAEITFRTSAAEEAIRCITAEVPEMVVGAGTVVNVGQAERAVRAGARFVVSPGFGGAIVDWCQANGVAIFPGVTTPTEIMMALDKGIGIVKFFPAEAYGGIATIKSLAAPFPQIKFMPTGGINAKNMADYLKLSAIFAVGGSWMVEGKLIAEGRFEEITRLTTEAVSIVRQVRPGT